MAGMQGSRVSLQVQVNSRGTSKGISGGTSWRTPERVWFCISLKFGLPHFLHSLQKTKQTISTQELDIEVNMFYMFYILFLPNMTGNINIKQFSKLKFQFYLEFSCI